MIEQKETNPALPLRRRFLRPRVLLGSFAVVFVLVLADSFRAPGDQCTGILYVQCVRFYQWGGRPLLKGHVQCRFEPTCSEYSIGAVETHGIRTGLWLTVNRLSRCTCDTPINTPDPVPAIKD